MFHLKRILLLLTSFVSFSVAASFFDLQHYEPKDPFSMHRMIYDPESRILRNTPSKDAIVERMEVLLPLLGETIMVSKIIYYPKYTPQKKI